MSFDELFENISVIRSSGISSLGVTVGQDLSDAVLANIVTTSNGIDPSEAPLVVASFPKIIPKLVGVEIVEGFKTNVAQRDCKSPLIYCLP